MRPEAEHDEVRRLLSDRLFDLAPVMMVAMDAEFRIVEANAAFARLFGAWEGMHCYELMKGRQSQCEQCQVSLAFADGKARLCDELLTVTRDTISQFIVRVAPLGKPGAAPRTSADRLEGQRGEHPAARERHPLRAGAVLRDRPRPRPRGDPRQPPHARDLRKDPG